MNPLFRFFIILISSIIVFIGVGLLGTYVYNLASDSKNVVEIEPESQHQNHTAFQDYEVYIDDAVRFILANAHPEYAYFDFENTELNSRTENKIENIASKIDNISLPRFKIALIELSTTGNKFEKKYSSRLLEIYNELVIDITSVQQDEQFDFVYHFIERNSRVRFTTGLSVLVYCTPDIWDLHRYTKYIETGVFEIVPDGSTGTDSLDDKITSNRLSLSDAEKESRNEILIDIVERAYSGQANDEEILYTYLHELISKNNDNDQWANLGYWKYSDGHLHSYHINGVQEDDWGNVYVMVHIEDMKYHDQVFGDIHDVWLGMIQDNGKWYISCIDGYTKENHLVYSSSDMIY